MQYVLIQNDIVINGPRGWNYRSFESSLLDDLEITYKLPTSKTDDVAIDIAAGIRILPVSMVETPYNPKVEFLHGPFWDFSNNVAVGSWEIHPNDIGGVKANLIQQAAAVRYNKEIAGVKVTIQNQEVTVDTSRDGRNIFVLKYMIMQDADTVNWKFPEGWLTLTKAELGAAVIGGAGYIQTQFLWEETKVSEIIACTTLQELDAVVIE
ncbi:hypothetical protein UFOVP49_225 [uncultured Caudovirales phage]|uniref:DUF4376 domain-containing protein n=1 Tax=uncultured Caudovirales phage TaxID=2100421 RepID=A0A6J5KU31_9CAUD|nr:hypothetical protein UFOVP49_225 [uncultured Caudovirales phage]